MATINNFNDTLTLSEGQTVSIDSDVTVSGSDIANGRLIVSGLLPEDIVAFAREGAIAVNGSALQYNGTVIGRIEGGVGATLTVFLTANANATNVEAAIEHLTYTSTSDNPTATRSLSLTLASPTNFGAQSTGPFSTIDAGSLAAPAIVDLTSDRRQDLVVAGLAASTGLLEYRLYTQQTNGTYVRATGSSDPFTTINSSSNVATDSNSAGRPAFIDIIGDERPEMVVGYYSSSPRPTNSGFAIFTLNANNQYVRYTDTDPFAATKINGANFFAPYFVDYDRDGDLDLVTGYTNGAVRSFTNNNGTFVASTTFLPQSSDLDGSVGTGSPIPAVFDVDGDGDLDLVVGYNDNTIIHT